MAFTLQVNRVPDTISLNEAVKPQSQLQTILNWLEQSSRPLTRDDIAKKDP